MYLRGLLKFHRHLGIPYMPRKPITHLQTGTHFDLDSGKHFPRSPPSAQTPWQFGERFILRQLTFHAKVSSVYFGCCTAELLFHQTTRGGGGGTINCFFVFVCLSFNIWRWTNRTNDDGNDAKVCCKLMRLQAASRIKLFSKNEIMDKRPSLYFYDHLYILKIKLE